DVVATQQPVMEEFEVHHRLPRTKNREQKACTAAPPWPPPLAANRLAVIFRRAAARRPAPPAPPARPSRIGHRRGCRPGRAVAQASARPSAPACRRHL